MESNRLLKISTAGSRKATHWPKTEILWSEFCDRLKTPIRGAETVEEYLAMPKSRQAELKDVGGFVGGTFTGDRRKAANVEGRDLVTLDLDNIPTGQTEDILRRVGGLGCAGLGRMDRSGRNTTRPVSMYVFNFPHCNCFALLGSGNPNTPILPRPAAKSSESLKGFPGNPATGFARQKPHFYAGKMPFPPQNLGQDLSF